MKKLLAILLLGLAPVLQATDALAAELKIGFVNTERVFRESQLAAKAQKKLEAEFAKREQELQRKIRQARDLQAQLEKEAMTLSEADKANKQRELANLNRDLQREQREFREDLNVRKNEEFAAIHDKARKIIMEVAEREKFDLILESVVYASTKIDITDRIIKQLDK